MSLRAGISWASLVAISVVRDEKVCSRIRVEVGFFRGVSVLVVASCGCICWGVVGMGGVVLSFRGRLGVSRRAMMASLSVLSVLGSVREELEK